MDNPILADLNRSRSYPEIDVELPTLANFYFPEDGIFQDGFDPRHVKVQPLGIAQELAIKDPLMVMGRQSTPLLVKALCPMVLKPEKLSEVDIIAIILAGRIASYGPKYRMDHVCQNPATSGKKKSELMCVNAKDKKPSTIEVDLYQHILTLAQACWLI